MSGSLQKAIDVINLINNTAPSIASLILTIRHNDGTEETVDLLNAADSQYIKNLKQIEERKQKEQA